MQALNEGMAAMAARLPWLFRRTEDIDLIPGSAQVLPPRMMLGFKVLGQVRSLNGRVYVSPITVSVTEPQQATDGCECPIDGMFAPCQNASGEFIIKSYALDRVDSSVLYVNPPVPNGTSAKLRVSYAGSEVLTSAAAFDNYTLIYSAIVDWMLYRAYSNDLRTDEVDKRAASYRDSYEKSVEQAIKTYESALQEGVK